MSHDHTTLEVDTDGSRPTVTKTAIGLAAARLEHEGRMLEAACHPGVVSLVDPAERGADGSVRLRTRFVGSRTLSTIGPIDPARAAGLVAALATTVADLHHLGIRHGRLTADHVILAADGRPVLCGFADAQIASNRTSTAAPLRPADDVAALGALLRELVAPTPATLEAPPARRWSSGRSSTTQHRGALLNLADQATTDDPARRPSARQFAEAIRTTVPEATLAADAPGATAVEEPSRPSMDGRLAWPSAPDLPPPGFLLVGACSGVVLLVLAVSVLWSGAGSSAPTDAPAAAAVAAVEPPATQPTPTTMPNSTTTSTTSPPTTTTAPPAAPADDVGQDPFRQVAGCSVTASEPATTSDGQPCPAPIALVGGVLALPEAEFQIDLTEAAVAIGDFACDGQVRPAVADLTEGHIFVFDRWASDAGPVDATAIHRIDAPRQLLAEPESGGCHQLVALDRWGIRHVVDINGETPP